MTHRRDHRAQGAPTLGEPTPPSARGLLRTGLLHRDADAADTPAQCHTFARLNSSSGEQAISPFGTLDALRVATFGGAPSVGMPGRLGMLKAGLPADLIAVDTGRLHLRPRGDAVGTVVDFCSNSDVDVDGTLRKWGEGIIGTDVARTIAEAERCRERVLGAVNTARPTAGRGYTGHAPGLLAPGLGVRLGGE
nr:amidohydrolase family protein [Streptomyces scabiei]